MLTDHETRREHDDHEERELPREGLSPREHDAQMKFPALEEPTWLDDDADEMEEPSDSPFRGMWIGIAAAAVTFVLVFAIPQWLGWYDYGPHYLLVALTVSLALIGVVTFGSLTGSMLPLVLRRLGFDPASASAPFVATLVDVTGLVIYFTVALLILRGTLL